MACDVVGWVRLGDGETRALMHLSSQAANIVGEGVKTKESLAVVA